MATGYDLRGCDDVQPHSNWKPPAKLVGPVVGVLTVYLESVQQKVFLDTFNPNSCHLRELAVVPFTSPATFFVIIMFLL